jgi:hypothetical protein
MSFYKGSVVRIAVKAPFGDGLDTQWDVQEHFDFDSNDDQNVLIARDGRSAYIPATLIENWTPETKTIRRKFDIGSKTETWKAV